MAALSIPELSSGRLNLRLLREDDATDLLTIFGDPEVMRYWSGEPWCDIGQAHQLLERDRASHADGSALRLGIERVGDRRIVGTVALFNLSMPNRRGEIGYALARREWGKGLMHEALSLFIDWIFGALGLHRLEADIDPANLASEQSLRRLGFQREGLLRERWIVAGKTADTALFGLLAREWLARPERRSP